MIEANLMRSLRYAILAVLAAAFSLAVCAAFAQPAHALKYSAEVYNGTVTGSNWGETPFVKSAKIKSGKLKLTNGQLATSRSEYDLQYFFNGSKTFTVSSKCKFYKTYDGWTGSKLTFSDRISKSKALKRLKKANASLGKGPYKPKHYAIAFKTSHGMVTKLAIKKMNS